MTQTNIYMEDDNLRLYVDVQPLFIDELENSKNSAAASAAAAAQSEANARNWKDDITDYKTNIELFYAQATDGITNSYNNSVSRITDAKNSALSTLQSQKNNILNILNGSLYTALNSIETNGQNYVDMAHSYADEARATVDNRVSTDHLNQSKGLETGCISDDEEVLLDIKNYAHSTYCGDQTEGSTPGYLSDGVTPLDSKKFTVVGSPVITNDGVASGFSSSNCIETPTFDFSKPWKISGSFKLLSSPTTNFPIIKIVGRNYANVVYFDYPNNKVVLNLYTSSGLGAGQVYTFSLNTDYNYELGWTGTEYYFYLYQGNNRVVNLSVSSTEALSISDQNRKIVLGMYPEVSSWVLPGSIDLKGVGVNVNGVEVFSGNKTGIDTIKPVNYTEVNSPVISTDGIMTLDGTNAKYITASSTIALSSANSWKIVTPVFTLEANGTSNRSIIGASSNQDGLDLFVRDRGAVAWRVNAIIGDNTSVIGTSTIDTPILNNDGTKYQLALEFTGTAYNVLLSTNGGTFTQINTFASTTKVTYNPTLYIGFRGNTEGKGTMDLNTMHVYVDGDLVYQPCLKIPYTESKTGSKIVNSIYRERVKDMYEQYGYAPYYTLSDSDFTLPMGEVYGMIEKLRQLIIQRTS